MPKHDIFISYSTNDLAIMLRIYKDLRLQGLNVWIDKKGIKVGDSSWQDAIADAIRNTSCIVVLFSPYSEQSPWVKEELNFAQNNKKQIFPVLLHGSDKDAVPFGYHLFQRVDIRTSYEKLYLELLPRLAQFLGKNLPDKRYIPDENTIDKEIEEIIEIAYITLRGRGEIGQNATNAAKEIERQRELIRLKKGNEALAKLVGQEIRKKEDYETLIRNKESALSAKQKQEDAVRQAQKERDAAIKQEKERQRELEAKAKQLKLANARFQVNNPLHWLLFLMWIFIDPERLTNYTDRYTSDTKEAIVARIASLLAWLSLLIPSLALSFNQIPIVQEFDWLRWFSFTFIIGFLITAWATQYEIKVAFIVVFLLAGTVALVVGASATNNEYANGNIMIMAWGIILLIGIAFMNGFILMASLAHSDELDPALVAPGMVIVLFSSWMILYEMGINALLACGFGFGISIATTYGIILLIQWPIQQRWLIIRLIALFPFLAPYVGLIWIYWFDGWQALLRIFS